ncbi:MAG: M28 family peptidase [Spirochaetia bacterium]|nr:M28 family peptidase [Spirochaetia bacterium]
MTSEKVLLPEVDPGIAEKLLRGIVERPLYRNYKNPAALNSAADFIKNQLQNSGYEPSEQIYFAGKNQYKNIRAVYGNPSLPCLIVGAHYDVAGDQDGADDNASGVTGLLILAELLKKEKPELKYHIEMVFYTLEEPPFFRTEFMGSYIHAKSIHDAGKKIMGMVSLEMIGYYSDAPGSQKYPLGIMKWFYPDRGDFIGVVSNFSSGSLGDHFYRAISKSKMKTEKLKAPSFLKGVDFSDHLNYWKFGYKAVMITDTAFFRNQNYHTKGDVISTIHFEKLAETVQGVYLGLVSL